ncbi:MAG: putative tail tubular protein [Prokaryotic dsDNA virus sp.]|jgi:hypothetical protein|nr:MAG: putative tail tubular protein [Prokaryotic dsDNA virus sp.]|tara:strand:+ start:5284 stop:8079 length:2796 start_codon:yes stop_codon:yes gene_type:complete
MPLINTPVANLIQGVSQQSDGTRFAGQCEEQENALSSVANGLMKRPNTRHVARLLTSAIDSDSFVHFINRSDAEKYVLIHDTTHLRAYNVITGAEATINGSTGGYAVSSTYLQTSVPRQQIKAATVADSTFLLNTDYFVQAKTDTTDALPNEALVFVSQGAYEKAYTITLSGSTAASTITTPAVLSVTVGSRDIVTFEYQMLDTIIRRVTKEYFVSSVSVDNAGAGYGTGTATIQFTSNKTVYADAVAQVTMSSNNNGSIGSVSIVNGGRYKGIGGQQPVQITTNLMLTITDPTPPTITAGISTGSGTTVSDSVTHGSGNSQTGSNANTDNIANDLTSKINNNVLLSGMFTATQAGSVIKIVGNSNLTSMAVITTDSLADSGLQAVHKEVNSISSLPLKCFNGFRVKIRGDAELNADDFYVKFETANGANFGEGSWVETVGFEISKGVEPTSMPTVIVNDTVNSFVLQDMSISERISGDDDTNPLPSFVNQRLTNIFFFKNRLGFLSGENVVLSESGLGVLDVSGNLEYNFGRTTVTTLLDSDPIDIAVASTLVTNLKSAKGYQENLILFADNGQFVLKGGDVLTPRTVSVTPITNFNFEDQVDPLPLGSYIYFPFTRGEFSGLREFTVNSTTDTYDSYEVTEHVPAYIPKNIIDIAGTTSEDIIVLLSGNEYADGTNAQNCLYVYNYFWNNNQKILSAWSKFSFTGEIRGMEFIESTLYAIIVNNGETNLVQLPLESGLFDEAGFVTHLDMRVSATITNGNNGVALPYTPENNSVEVYTKNGIKLSCTNFGAAVTLTEAVTEDTDVFVGIPYTMKYTFSEQIFKAKSGQGNSPSNVGKLLIRNGSIYFDKTSFFKVKVTPKLRDTYENIFTPDSVGSTTTPILDSGFYRFPVLTKAEDTTITIENDSALPSNLQSAEFESFLHSRSSRYA